jgi:GNAT superfamily N-acetyltransferase
MTMAEKNLAIRMARAHLDDVPEFALPGAFSLRWYQPGDEAHWLRIHLAADRFNEITPELFRKQFGVAPERGLQPAAAGECRSGMNSALRDLRERQCYLLAPTGEAVGTGTAWFNDDFEGARWGRVHWMAIVPEFQGRGLAKPLLTWLCRRLRELGHERVCLTTSTARRAAIGLYLKFGFAPLIRGEADAAVWREVLASAVPKA